MPTIGDKLKQEENRKLLSNPRVKAMLNTIAYAEGADYNTRVGGSTFMDLSKKPGKKTYIKSIGNYSTAEGRYQFLNSTWDSVAKDLGLKDFSPQSQDLAAIELIKRRGAMGDVLSGDLGTAVSKLNKEWASLPTKSGRSAYSRQNARSMASLKDVFEGNSGGSTYKDTGDYYDTTTDPQYKTIRLTTMGDVAYNSIPSDIESTKEEETPEVLEAKEKIDKVTAEQEVIREFFTQNEIPKQQAPQQEAQQEAQEFPTIGEQYAQVSQLIDNPIAQQGGSIPISSQGVYDYPMQEVIVPTSNGRITMDKVEYPILGIDEFGNKKIMQPGKDYKFPGKTIHEIPQLKNYFNKR